jgi:hypothetical protein
MGRRRINSLRLPAPNGPFWVAMRIYWPEQAALDGTWKHQPMTPVR